MNLLVDQEELVLLAPQDHQARQDCLARLVAPDPPVHLVLLMVHLVHLVHLVIPDPLEDPLDHLAIPDPLDHLVIPVPKVLLVLMELLVLMDHRDYQAVQAV